MLEAAKYRIKKNKNILYITTLGATWRFRNLQQLRTRSGCVLYILYTISTIVSTQPSVWNTATRVVGHWIGEQHNYNNNIEQELWCNELLMIEGKYF